MRSSFVHFLFYGDCARVDKAESGGAQTTHVRSALVVANDISFGCLNKLSKLILNIKRE